MPIPSRSSARSRPRLLIVVATIFGGSSSAPVAQRERPEVEDGVAVPHLAALVGQDAAVGVAVEGGSEVRALGHDPGRHLAGRGRAAALVHVAAVRLRVQERHPGAQALEDLAA